MLNDILTGMALGSAIFSTKTIVRRFPFRSRRLWIYTCISTICFLGLALLLPFSEGATWWPRLTSVVAFGLNGILLVQQWNHMRWERIDRREVSDDVDRFLRTVFQPQGAGDGPLALANALAHASEKFLQQPLLGELGKLLLRIRAVGAKWPDLILPERVIEAERGSTGLFGRALWVLDEKEGWRGGFYQGGWQFLTARKRIKSLEPVVKESGNRYPCGFVRYCSNANILEELF